MDTEGVRETPTDLLRAILTRLSYRVEAPARMRGNSGVMHDFEILAFREGEVVAVERAEPGRPVLNHVIALWARAFDTGLTKLFLIAEEPDEEARRLARSYAMNLVSADATEEELERRLATDTVRPLTA